jgi:hypothetical protein
MKHASASISTAARPARSTRQQSSPGRNKDGSAAASESVFALIL